MPFLGIPTSKKDLGNAGWIKGAAVAGARGAGAVTPRVGPLGHARDALFNTAQNINNPNVNVFGAQNPQRAIGGAVARPAAQPIAQNYDFYGDGGVYGPGGGGGGRAAPAPPPYDPNTDPVRIAQKRQEVRNLMGAFEQAFNEVLGKVDQLAAEKRGEFEKNYADQQMGLDKNFGTTSTGIDDQYSARNAYHSSYRENAQQQAKDAYETATGSLGQAKNKDLATVGQFAETQKAELGGSRPTFNVDDYGEVDDLLTIGQDVQAAVNKIKTTGAGIGTNSQYLSKLNSIAPVQETGSAQLKTMLDKLAMTGESNPDAKRAIAQSTIAKIGGDQSAWMDYFEKQLKQTGSGAVATAIA